MPYVAQAELCPDRGGQGPLGSQSREGESVTETSHRALLILIAALVGTIVGETTGILVAVDGGSISQCFMAGGGAFAGCVALLLGVFHALKVL